ncbi:MAG: Hsp20/alpha crystallin family protein [Treponema sp.]|nr:Hsp20/alpha crystallin family protein [Treponema sp.]
MTTLNLYRPNSIQNVLGDFERYFDSFFGGSVLTPAADIRENEQAYILSMDLPGYDEKNINVHVDGSYLTIAFKQNEEKNEEGDFILKERRTNAFTRSFKLPENADKEAVNASFINGVLRLEIMKRPEAQKRLIQINAANNAA